MTIDELKARIEESKPLRILYITASEAQSLVDEIERLRMMLEQSQAALKSIEATAFLLRRQIMPPDRELPTLLDCKGIANAPPTPRTEEP